MIFPRLVIYCAQKVNRSQAHPGEHQFSQCGSSGSGSHHTPRGSPSDPPTSQPRSREHPQATLEPLPTPGGSSWGREALALMLTRKLPKKTTFMERFSFFCYVFAFCILYLQPRLHMHLKRKKSLKTPIFLITVLWWQKISSPAQSLGRPSSKKENTHSKCWRRCGETPGSAGGSEAWGSHAGKQDGESSKN